MSQLAKLMGVKRQYVRNQVIRGIIPSERRNGRPIIYSHVLREEMPTLYKALQHRMEEMGEEMDYILGDGDAGDE